ncbi:MAG: FKBP-type peptidyl-prolyl cis-trans isomerase [Flavobacterium sp.]|uniref:FKBP-type peptidyl-prolyl cis-trans isomerase n=1 Tax=Flavobacterium sp. TaxID=239 RepID=UPI003265A45E
MIRIFKVGFIFIMSLVIFSCNKSEDTVNAYVVPFAEQYPVDNAAIETFLKSHSITPVNNPGFSDDQDVTFTSVTAGDASSIWGSDPLNPKPSLLSIPVTSNGVDYKVYYISLRQGTNENPTRVDSAFVSYKGRLLNETVFDQAENPVWFPLDNVIQGWKEILPKFKTGDPGVINPLDGTVSYSNFGAGVMFLPSGLGYYNGGVGSIPSYSPLIFSFKLKGLNYVDHDRDHIDSRYEDANGNGIFTDDDTDGDGRPDYLDIDDDADGIPTKTEIRISNGVFYDFANIPLCTDGKKKHLSATCH